jgi:predicted O-methyltransferase YrrM
MHNHLKKIFESGEVIGQDGKIYKLSSGISIKEGLFLQQIIKEIRPKISLEVGLAQGISTMFICETLKEIRSDKHIVVDPFQIESDDHGFSWSRLGLYNLEQCNYNDIVDFKNERSEIVLPNLLKQELKIDFAFIDGLHTFDQVLLDFYYINRILNIGGVVVFDDSSMKSVNKAINYFRNYPAYIPYKITNQYAGVIKQPGFSWSYSLNKLIKKPEVLPLFILRNLKLFFSPIKNLYLKKILGLKKNIIIHSGYYALQKISDDSRPWTWYQNF